MCYNSYNKNKFERTVFVIEPQNIPRNEFPESRSRFEKMIPLEAVCDNNEMNMLSDIKYIERGDMPLYIQLIMPDRSDGKPPLVVYVTGSAFHWQNIPQTIPRLSLLANRGIMVASVQYRGSEAAAFPAQMLDAKASVRFMKLNAEKYGFDTERVYLMGDSSGGHTVLMSGLTSGIPEFEEDIYSEVSSDVNGIIDFYGPVDISKMNDELSTQNHMLPDSPEGLLIGGKNVAENSQLASPTVVTNYISAEKEIPPILIFHGMNDELVPFGQSCILSGKLDEYGKKFKFYAVKDTHHGGREFWSNRVLDIVENFVKFGRI